MRLVLSASNTVPFQGSKNRSTIPGELIHSDVCGPMQNASIGGSRYFVLFKDDVSNLRTVYFIKEESEGPGLIEKFIKTVKRETNFDVKTMRTDNGTEYINESVKKLCESHGIVHQTTVPYTPEQNGRSERDMRTIVEADRTMNHEKNLSLKFWAESVNTAVYVLNRSGPVPTGEATPFEMWHRNLKEPKDEIFNVFGAEVFVHVPDQKRQKWNKKSRKGIFLGYCENRVIAFGLKIPRRWRYRGILYSMKKARLTSRIGMRP